MVTSTRTLERSIWIPAPRTTVWDAITIPEQLGSWLLPPALGATMALDDDRLSVVMGGVMSTEVALIETTDAPRRLTMRGLPDRLVSITWILEDEADGTRATVITGGFEALAPDAVEDRWEAMGPAWEKALANLKAFVQGSQLPHPDGHVAALFGYRRHTSAMLAVERSIWIESTPERVWDAITEPEQIQDWFSPGSQWRRSGDGVGARLSVYDPTTGEDTHVEVVETVERPHRLVTRSEAGATQPSQVTAWVLSVEAGGTRVTVTVSGYESQAADARDNDMEQNAFGFGMMLQNLRAYLAGETLPFPWGF